MVQNILSLERTIDELNEEIVKVTEKIQEKNKKGKTEKTTTTTKTVSEEETSTYFPTKLKSDKKIRIKIPPKKKSQKVKPKIQPYEYPIITENLTERTSLYTGDSTTVIYAIPYTGHDEELSTMKPA